MRYYDMRDFEDSPDWKPSFGEDLGKVHFRNGHYHAVCDPATSLCTVHYDEHDPHESFMSLLKHMWGSTLGKVVLLGIVAIGVGAGAAAASRR